MRISLPMRFLITGLVALCLQLLLMMQGVAATATGLEEASASIARPGVQVLAAPVDGRGLSFSGHGGKRHCLADPGRSCCDRQHDVARHVIWRPEARSLPRPKGKGLTLGCGTAGQDAQAVPALEENRFSSVAALISPVLANGAVRHGRRLLHVCCRLLI